MYSVGGNVKGCSHYGKKSGGSFKNKMIIWSSNPTPGYISKGTEIKISKRYLHTHVHCNVIHNSYSVKQSKCPSMEEWRKMGCIYTMRYHLSFKRGNFDICKNMDRPGGHCAKLARHRKTNTAWSHLYMKSKIAKFREAQTRMIVTRDQREGGNCMMKIKGTNFSHAR